MQRAEEIALAERLLDYKTRRTQSLADAPFENEITAYTDVDRLRRERQLLFRQMPLLLGLSGQLLAAGDYLTHDLAGVPILVVRGEDGAARAFLNVCRHRGARLLEGCAHTGRHITCPYHAWTYDSHGRLVALPQQGRFGDIDKASRGLTPLPVVEKDGLLFVQPGPGEGFDLDAHLGGLMPELAAYGLDRYVLFQSKSMSYAFNWKIVIDTFLEVYHLPVLHPTTVNPLIDASVLAFDAYGRNLRMVAARKGFERLRDEAPESRSLLPLTAVIYVLFPNTVFIWQADHVEIWSAYPDGDDPDRSTVTFALYAPEPVTTESARRHWQKNYDIALATVEAEDFPLSETIQAGFHSGAQSTLVYGRNEPALIHFHRSLRTALGIA
ncbi:MAG: Rieske 2Fe-2S domain-containing protein [Gammaproteobacteria bacterium]|nr:Rieske 2Fe-2S domain-containing protein [Gammaproteobacteria bacterium]